MKKSIQTEMDNRKFDFKKEVSSLRLCKRLKELGYPQEGGGWYWVVKGNNFYLEPCFVPNVERWITDLVKDLTVREIIKAPTCREMGEWLPKVILNEYSLYYTQVKNGWIIDYANPDNNRNQLNWEVDYTEPDVRAKMLIWLA